MKLLWLASMHFNTQRHGMFSLPIQGEKSRFHAIVNTQTINHMWEKVQHAADKTMQYLRLAFLSVSHTELLKVSSYCRWNRYVAQQWVDTSIMGEGDFRDECSNGRSSASRQVTSPIGNLDPYLPALPTKRMRHADFAQFAPQEACAISIRKN
jgi:hypothetical protein